jgi:chromosome segregation ATPase
LPTAYNLTRTELSSRPSWTESRRFVASSHLTGPIFTSRQKLNALRIEADHAVARAEEAEAKNKRYEQVILEKDQEITSLTHKLNILDGDLEKAESKVTELKSAQQEGEHSKSTNEGLLRKIQLLEEELDAAEKNVKETVEKCVLWPYTILSLILKSANCH